MRGVFAALEANHPLNVVDELRRVEDRLERSIECWGWTALTVAFSVGAGVATVKTTQLFFAVLGVMCGIAMFVAARRCRRG